MGCLAIVKATKAINFRHYVLKIESVSNYGFVADDVQKSAWSSDV